MKTIKYQSLIILAAAGLSVQTNYAADSLSPSGYLNASAGSDLGTSYLAASAPNPGVTVVNSSISVPILDNPGQSFAEAVSSSGAQINNPGGQQPLVAPEPTTLALTGFGGLAALVFLRRFGKTNRA